MYVRALAAAILSITVAVSAHGQLILYVDDDAPAGGDGSSWAMAYSHLQDAITFASPPGPDGFVKIRIGQGTYFPDRDADTPAGDGDRSRTFNLPDGVDFIGGFAGYGAGDPFQRDPERFVTALSGDIGVSGNAFDDSLHVITAVEITGLTEVNGVVVENGHAEGSGNVRRGGGVFIEDASPRFVNCIFRDCIAQCGGAATTLGQSAPSFSDCLFENNEARSGGAVEAVSLQTVTFEACIFRENEATGGSGADGDGGAIYGESVVLTECIFDRNLAEKNGGAARIDQSDIRRCLFLENTAGAFGGALRLESASHRIDQCLFLGNRTLGLHGNGSDGGAVHHFGSESEALVMNSLFNGNVAFRVGGGYCNGADEGPTRLVNCTFSNNVAKNGGGVSISTTNFLGASQVINCIVAGNTGTVLNDEIDFHPDVIVEYSCLLDEDWTGPGNIDLDPVFVDFDGEDNVAGNEDDDLRLSVNSPCIDAADNLGLPSHVLADLTGNARYRDDSSTPDTGNPGLGLPIIDMGSHEFVGVGTVQAELQQVEATFGLILAGGIDELHVGDERILRAASQFGFSAMEPNLLQLTFEARAIISEPDTLSMTVIHSTNNPGGVAKLGVKDLKTGSFEIVHISGIGAMPVLAVAESVDAAGHVEQDGTIVANVRHSIVATFSASGFESSFDLVALFVSEK